MPITDRQKRSRLTQLSLAVLGYSGAAVIVLGGVVGWNLVSAVGAVMFVVGLGGVLVVGWRQGKRPHS